MQSILAHTRGFDGEVRLPFLLLLTFQYFHSLNTTGSNASTSIPPMRPPEARAALLWSPPSAPGLGNTNDRRMQHARAATTSAFSANSAGLQVSAPRRPHHPFPAPSIAMRGYGPHHSHPSQRNNLTRTSLATEFIIYILPHGVRVLTCLHADY